MANLAETINYDTNVYQLETIDPVQGGPNGISNAQAKALSNRTAWLKKHIEDIEQGNTVPVGLAKINSPTFTGTPAAPTPPLGDNDTSIATTEFVQATIAGELQKNVGGNINTTLTAVEAGNGILNFFGALTGNVAVIVPAVPHKFTVLNNTTGAFTLTVKTAAGAGVDIEAGKWKSVVALSFGVYPDNNEYKDIALTGAPTAQAPSSGSNDNRLATTSFVWNAVDGFASIDVSGGSNVVLTAAQAGTAIISLGGALTANISVIVPSQSGQWIFGNGTTGGFSVSVKTASRPGVILPPGRAISLYCDGNGVNNVEAGQEAAWGGISGTLANQTDLQNALNSKASGTHTHAAADITSGVLSTARLGTGTANATTYLRGDGTWAVVAAPSATAWGGITGTLSNQTDLQTALNAKAASSHTHAAGDITSGVFSTARLGAGAASAVNYLRGDGNWAQVSWGEMAGTLANQADLQSALNAKAASSHTHAAADITSGVLATARLGTGVANTTTFLRGDGTWGVVPVPAAPAWGGIGGTLSNQTDLQTALNGKSDSVHTHTDKASLSGATFTGAVVAPSFNSTSSRRYKENIELLDVDEALSMIEHINFSGYNLKADGSFQYGVIAEDLVGGRLDFVVNRNELGEPESVNYQPLFVLAAGAVQSLSARLARLEQLIHPVG